MSEPSDSYSEFEYAIIPLLAPLKRTCILLVSNLNESIIADGFINPHNTLDILSLPNSVTGFAITILTAGVILLRIVFDVLMEDSPLRAVL